MADITFTRQFSHRDWIDNEDVVQAEGENGFNVRFHAIEDDLNEISTVVGNIDTEIKRIQRLNFLQAVAGVRVNANSASEEFDVEIYDRSGMPENVEKVYTAILFPISGPTHIQHTFLYRVVPGNQVKVTVQFFNPGGAQARFNFRVLTLATQD